MGRLDSVDSTSFCVVARLGTSYGGNTCHAAKQPARWPPCRQNSKFKRLSRTHNNAWRPSPTTTAGCAVGATRQARVAQPSRVVWTGVPRVTGETSVISMAPPCLSLLKHLIKVQGGAIKMTELSPTAKNLGVRGVSGMRIGWWAVWPLPVSDRQGGDGRVLPPVGSGSAPSAQTQTSMAAAAAMKRRMTAATGGNPDSA